MLRLEEEGLWPAQIKAITNLEQSLRENRPRSLIQMGEWRVKEPPTPAHGSAGRTTSVAGLRNKVTGPGKTFTSISFIYRLIKFAGARRVLFLVDRGNPGNQTLKEFQQHVSSYNNFKFSEEYIVQRLSSNALDTTARVSICTIQRMYSMLKSTELPEDAEEMSVAGLEQVWGTTGHSRIASDKARGERAAELPDSAMSKRSERRNAA
jgi:type I restriction enzyme R subunit